LVLGSQVVIQLLVLIFVKEHEDPLQKWHNHSSILQSLIIILSLISSSYLLSLTCSIIICVDLFYPQFTSCS